jgi:hypothetical protein
MVFAGTVLWVKSLRPLNCLNLILVSRLARLNWRKLEYGERHLIAGLGTVLASNVRPVADQDNAV